MKKISQRQARYYLKEGLRLTREMASWRNRWAAGWAGGWVNIASLKVDDAEYAKITTARLLKHAVVVVPDNGNILRFYADPLK